MSEETRSFYRCTACGRTAPQTQTRCTCGQLLTAEMLTTVAVSVGTPVEPADESEAP